MIISASVVAARPFFSTHVRRAWASGFTLIELIVALVVIGLLTATAAPRLVSQRSIQVQTAAAQATAIGLAQHIERGGSLNHAVDLALEANLTTVRSDPFYTISNCTHGVRMLARGALPSGYAIASSAVADKEATTCTLLDAQGTAAEFVLIGALPGS